MLVAYYDSKGNKQEKKLELQDEVFKTKINNALIAQAVDTYWSNQRQSNAHTKDRGAVSGGGRKPWRQKGTGRARVGSIRSPLWKGGGVTFGPSNVINYAKKMSSKMKKAAIRAGFSHQAANDNIVVYADLGVTDKLKTSELVKILKDFGKEKVMLVQATSNLTLFNAAHNIKNVDLEVVNELNLFGILKAHKIIILEPALESIYKFWGTVKKEKPVTKAVKVSKPVVKKAVK
jgi:large subunit ribosomal protein L4